jgi:outer membrane lipoprotein-sorting protein
MAARGIMNLHTLTFVSLLGAAFPLGCTTRGVQPAVAVTVVSAAQPPAPRPKKHFPIGVLPKPESLAASNAAEIADRVEAAYVGLTTFRASFKQRYIVTAYGRQKDSTGSVSFARPNKASWRYANGNRVVFDGQRLQIYELADQRVYEPLMRKSQHAVALSFLTSRGNWRGDYYLSKLSSTQLRYPTGHVLLGRPFEPPQAGDLYEKALFYVDAKTFHVRRVVIVDAASNRNTIDFSSLEHNPSLPPDEFSFSSPPGTQVIRY